MINLTMLTASTRITFNSILSNNQQTLVTLVIWVAAFLCLLNIFLAIIYRNKPLRERVTYYLACLFELVVFVLALLLTLHVTSVIYHLPPGLPINQAEIGAALTIGIGLFPAAYWHRVNLAELPKRIAADSATMKDAEANVQIRKSSAPGEWMN